MPVKSRNVRILKDTYFTNRMFYKFFIPSLVSSIGFSFGNIVDAIVVGTRMGETGLAAIALILPIYMVFNVLDIGIAVGGSVHYTRLLGAGKAREGVKSFNQMLYASLFTSFILAIAGHLLLPNILLILGVHPEDGTLYEAARSYAGILLICAPLFFVSSLLYHYVRCDDNQRLASIGFLAGNAVDFILNFVFVIYLGMDIKGAALATVIGRAVSICIYLPHLLLKWTIIRLQAVKPDIRLIWDNFKNGFASSSQYIFQLIFFIVINNLLIRTGGEMMLAVFNMVTNASYVLLAVYEGTGAAIQPLAGTFSGEKNRKAEKTTLYMALKWGVFLGACAALLSGIFAEPLCRIFGLSQEVSADMAVRALRLYCISTLPAGFSVMMSNYYQAVDKRRLVFIITFLRTFGIYLLFSLVFLLINTNMFWWTFAATEFVSLALWLAAKKAFEKRYTIERDAVIIADRIFNRTITRFEDFGSLTSDIEEFCNTWSASFTQQYYVNLTVEEICQSIICNGFEHMEDGYIELTLIAYEDNTFELHIRDNAISFNPFDMHTKRIELDNDEGMDNIGILMVKNKAKEFFYRRYQGFNTLTVRV